MPIKIEYVVFDAQEFMAKLKDRNSSAVGRALGLSPTTINHLAKGDTERVSLKTRADVTDYLKNNG